MECHMVRRIAKHIWVCYAQFVAALWARNSGESLDSVVICRSLAMLFVLLTSAVALTIGMLLACRPLHFLLTCSFVVGVYMLTGAIAEAGKKA